MSESYARLVDGFKIGLDSLACGLAVATGEPVITPDVLLEPRWKSWLWLAQEHDFRACWSFPVKTFGGTVVGTFAMYFSEPRSPTPGDLELAATLTTTAAIIISRHQEADQRERAGLALRESEARLQAAVNLVKLGCYSWNPQTDELQWDDTLRAMWGLPAGAPVDHALWRACIHPEDLSRVEAAVQQCSDPSGDGIYDIEYRVIGRMDGVERWVATRGQTQFNANTPVSFFGVALDITDRKRIEGSLERRVEARTRELEEANQRLRSQIERREKAEAEVEQLLRLEAIGQITSGIAHDFNNLLFVVLINARLLSHRIHDDDDRKGIQLICDAAEHGVKLTTQLLAFSRKQRLTPEAVDFNRTIAGMRDLLSATMGGTIRLKTTVADDLWPAAVDPTQIQSIILNLVINARDAMTAGGLLTLETFNITIDNVSAGPLHPPPGQYVGLTVSDTGIGIPDDVLPHIFEPFFTTKKPGRNSGLGLAQVFGFAKQSGGGVEIETCVGKGTSVKVFLPRAEDSLNHQQKAEAGQDTPANMTVRILVVDDDESVLRSMLRMLKAAGYSALRAASGAEALELIARDSKIDLVLSDFAMPDMTGVDLAKAIRATNRSLPVLLVTGYADREGLSNLDEAQILQKPFSEQELVKRIMSILGSPHETEYKAR
jgi:PAS domain S-box-containing protein